MRRGIKSHIHGNMHPNIISIRIEKILYVPIKETCKVLSIRFFENYPFILKLFFSIYYVSNIYPKYSGNED